MKIIKPPYRIDLKASNNKKIFLAGSINQGKSFPWADKLAEKFSETNNIFFNPRRNNWNSELTQSIDNPEFFEQVNWEIDHLLRCDIVVFFIDKEGQSPVTLIELGMMSLMNASKKTKVIVCCEKGFFRRGNVEIQCHKFKMPLVDTFDELIELLENTLNE